LAPSPEGDAIKRCHCPYTFFSFFFSAVFEPVDPMFGFCVADHLCVLVAEFSVDLHGWSCRNHVVGVSVYTFRASFAYFRAFLSGVREYHHLFLVRWMVWRGERVCP